MSQERLVELLTNVLGKGKPTNRGNHAFICPFCNTQKRKLEVQVQTTSNENHWHCWVCNASGKRITTLFKALNLPRERFTELYKLQNKPDFGSLTRTVISSYNESISLPKEFKPLWIPSNSIEYKNAIYYLLKRNVTLSEIVKYGIGYCETGEYEKKIIIPSYDSVGKLNYFVGRSYYEGVAFKHKNPDVSKNIIGFELFINWSMPLVLVEGSFDAISVRRNVIPLFGKTISENLRKKVIEKSVKQLYICLDKDAQKQALQHAEYFMNNGIEVYFVDLQEKDPAEIGFEKISQLIKQTPKLTFEKFIMYKLNL
jgi:DNA primase